MINRLYKLLTNAIGMKTTCCHTDKYSVIEKNPVCTNESCNNYLAQTDLKNIFTISFTNHFIKTS
jgi:hypothetical protein